MINEKRLKYLQELADEHNVNIDIVCQIAEFLGEIEDYDGLVSEVELYSFLYPEDQKLHLNGDIMEYTPDSWVVLKIYNDEKPFYKVLAGWNGGYLDGDSWRINSGISQVKHDNNYYEFYGKSGSLYRVHESAYRLTMATSGIYNQLKDRFGDRVELMPEDTNWMEIEW